MVKAFPPHMTLRGGGGWTGLLSSVASLLHHCELGPTLEVDCCHRAETGSDAGQMLHPPAKAAWGIPSGSIRWVTPAPPS